MDDRTLFNLRRSTQHVADEDSARPVIWRVPRNFDFDAPGCAKEMHSLKEGSLCAASKARLPRRKFQNCGSEPIGLEIRVTLQRAYDSHGLFRKDKSPLSDRVTAHVRPTAPAPFRFVPHVAGVAVEIAEEPGDDPQVA